MIKTLRILYYTVLILTLKSYFYFIIKALHETNKRLTKDTLSAFKKDPEHHDGVNLFGTGCH